METLTRDQQYIWFNPQLVEGDPETYFDIERWTSQGAVIGSAEGRGTTWFVRTPILDVAIRHYYRGGLFGKLVRDQYWFEGWENTRSAKEFLLLEHLVNNGLPVPRPVAARAIKDGLTYRADLVVEKIADAKDLVAVLQKRPLLEHDYVAIGKLVHRLHRASVCHTDLNIHNILKDEDGKLWLIDFDKCQIQDGESWKDDNLARLHRSFVKEKNKRDIHWQSENWKAVLQGYTGS